MANDGECLARCLTWAVLIVLVAVVLYYGWMWWQKRMMPVTPANGKGNSMTVLPPPVSWYNMHCGYQ